MSESIDDLTGGKVSEILKLTVASLEPEASEFLGNAGTIIEEYEQEVKKRREAKRLAKAKENADDVE